MVEGKAMSDNTDLTIQNSPPDLIPKSATGLLDVSAPERWVALKSNSARFVHYFSPLTFDDWLEHERAVRPMFKFLGEEIETSNRLLRANVALWEKKLLRTEGYPQMAAIPMAHRNEAVKGLGLVLAAENQDELPDADAVPVKLEALWNGVYFTGLVHLFRRPSLEHEFAFQEAAARSALLSPRVGGQRGRPQGVSEVVSLPQLRALVKLYDELILETAGYQFIEGSDRKISMDAASTKKLFHGGGMDSLHKSAAVRALFSRSAAVELELAESENA